MLICILIFTCRVHNVRKLPHIINALECGTARVALRHLRCSCCRNTEASAVLICKQSIPKPGAALSQLAILLHAAANVLQAAAAAAATGVLAAAAVAAAVCSHRCIQRRHKLAFIVTRGNAVDCRLVGRRQHIAGKRHILFWLCGGWRLLIWPCSPAAAGAAACCWGCDSWGCGGAASSTCRGCNWRGANCRLWLRWHSCAAASASSAICCRWWLGGWLCFCRAAVCASCRAGCASCTCTCAAAAAVACPCCTTCWWRCGRRSGGSTSSTGITHRGRRWGGFWYWWRCCWWWCWC